MGKCLTNNEFILKSQDKHGDKYDYSKVKYIGSKNQIIIICPIHGEFLQRPNDHLNGCGCKKCQYQKTSNENKFTNTIFIKKANVVHGNVFDYSLVDYRGYENKIKIVCSKHGVFLQSPHAHLQGTGCPSCSESRGERKIAEILTKNNIVFIREKTFPDLKNKSQLFYDFYLPEHRVLIEYHGKQHCKPIKFFGGELGFMENRKRDLIKLRFAINNNYLLLSIYDIPIKCLDDLLMNALKYKLII